MFAEKYTEDNKLTDGFRHKYSVLMHRVGYPNQDIEYKLTTYSQELKWHLCMHDEIWTRLRETMFVYESPRELILHIWLDMYHSLFSLNSGMLGVIGLDALKSRVGRSKLRMSLISAHYHQYITSHGLCFPTLRLNALLKVDIMLFCALYKSKKLIYLFWSTNI